MEKAVFWIEILMDFIFLFLCELFNCAVGVVRSQSAVRGIFVGKLMDLEIVNKGF